MPDNHENIKTSSYYVHNLVINSLWGIKNIDITFDKKVNVIVGQNASGKTTILNLLRYVFTLDFSSLFENVFDEIQIGLRSFDDKHTRTVKVRNTQKSLSFIVSRQVLDIDLDYLTYRYPISIRKRILDEKKSRLIDSLGKLVPAVWLPVSRRLPMPEDEERERRIGRPITMESVDVRLRELLRELSNYRLRLEAQLAEQYKKFEKQVMQVILYSKEFDTWDSATIRSDIQADKEHLLAAYKAAGLLDSGMKDRINEHFISAEAARKRVEEALEKKDVGIKVNDAFVVPLIRRTRSMIEYARTLEKERDSIFAPLRRYEKIVKSFIKNKEVRVDEFGNLSIKDLISNKNLEPTVLSSGEKQLLIMLTQALLWEDRPVVYVVDEPELSLHVTWQSKLLKSLLELAREIQIIVATHSPDIVAEYRNNVIDLEKQI